MITIRELKTALDKLDDLSTIRLTNEGIMISSDGKFIGYISPYNGLFVPAYNAPPPPVKTKGKNKNATVASSSSQ